MTLASLASHLGILPTADRWKVSQAINTVIPTHWCTTRLDTLATVQNGFPFESVRFNTSRGLPLIRIRDIGTDDSETLYDGDYDDAFLVHAGDILIGMDGEFRCRRWRGRTGLLNQRVCRVRFDPALACENFYYLILQPYLTAVQSATSSVTVAHLSSKTVEQLELPLPPLAEQERIAAQLDLLNDHRRQATEALDAVPPLLDKLRQSILAAAFRGDLTADWRAKNPDVEPADKLLDRIRASHVPVAFASPQWSPSRDIAGLVAPYIERATQIRWQTAPLAALCDPSRPITYGIVQTGDHTTGGVPTVRCGDVRPSGIDLSELKLVASDIEAQYPRTRLRGGEVLVAIRGTVGGVAIATSDLAGANISREVAMLAPQPGLLPEFLALALASPFGASVLATQTKGVAQSGINIADLRNFPVMLPPHAEQVEIVRRLKRMLATVERLEILTAELAERATQITPSILAKAFRGELVAQDPNDEPASVLLERLRAARGSADTAPRGGGRRPSAASTPAPTPIARPTPPAPPRPTAAIVAPTLAAAESGPTYRATSVAPAPLDADTLITETVAALWRHGAVDKDAAIRRVADHLREAGRVTFQRLRADGPLYAQLADAIDAAVKAGRLDRPTRGAVRAYKADPTAYTTDDWRHALLAVLGPTPTDREDALRAAADWARDHCGLAFTRLRADGHIMTGLRSALSSAIRAKLITRIDATRIARAPAAPTGQLSFPDVSPDVEPA